MRCDKKDLLLYAVTDRSLLKGRTLCECVEAAIKGGATLIQLREKELCGDKLINEAIEISRLCKKYNVPFIVNDDVEAAISSDADGVHVGQSDMAADEVRGLIGDEKILGVSVQTAEQAIKAEKNGADYLGVGTIFPTSSKSDAELVSLDTLKEICRSVSVPVVAIGGIGSKNISELKDSGICGIAAISAIFAADDIERAAGELKRLTYEAVRK